METWLRHYGRQEFYMSSPRHHSTHFGLAAVSPEGWQAPVPELSHPAAARRWMCATSHSSTCFAVCLLMLNHGCSHLQSTY